MKKRTTRAIRKNKKPLIIAGLCTGVAAARRKADADARTKAAGRRRTSYEQDT